MEGTDLSPAPSTYDALPGIAGGQDEVTVTLTTALERYRTGATAGTYWNPADGSVCAGGALIVAQGEDWDEWMKYSTEDWLEERAKSATLDAIKLLNKCATELFPWTGDVDPEDHPYPFGPIEYLNEMNGLDDDELVTWKTRKERVITVYECAIARRRGQAA